MDAIKCHRELKLSPNPDALFHLAAEDFMFQSIDAIKNSGRFTVALAGGETAKLFYDKLTSVEFFLENIPWKNIFFFFGDERYVPADDPESNYLLAQEHLFSKIPIPAENIFRMPTEYAEPKEAAKKYEQTLRQFFQLKENELPRFDLIYLGLGQTLTPPPLCLLVMWWPLIPKKISPRNR